MGADPRSLPETFKRYLAKEERKEIPILRTFEDAEEDRKEKEEEDMHKQFENYLLMKQIPYVHSRMDRKSTIREGWPDFTLLKNGKCLLIEFKAGNKKPTVEQVRVIVELTQAKCPVFVCYSVKDAIVKTVEIFEQQDEQR